MGAESFIHHSAGKTADEAFNNAVESAQYAYGHSGYSGSIAEKGEFVEIPLPEGKDAEAYAEELMDADDERIADKWGPAGCITISEGKYLFFGWASS